MYQQLWRYEVEEKLYLGVREQKRLNTTVLFHGHQQNPSEDEATAPVTQTRHTVP
jgi:hypothetical protein